MAGSFAAHSAPDRDLDAAANGVGLRPLFQPIVSLPEARVVGYEALARWPRTSSLSPLSVFTHAARTRNLDSLDRACLIAAVETAFDVGIPRGSMLAVNCEPASTFSPASDVRISRAASEFAMVFELTERNLLSNPAALIRKVAALRAAGFAVALDDVGAHTDSLALLDVIEPEVIKLDWNLIQGQTRRHQTQTLAAVLAHHERTGAVIVAEGIETEAHQERAVAVGAALGQGYKFGSPQTPGTHDLCAVMPWTADLLPRNSFHAYPVQGESPFDWATRNVSAVSVRSARKATLTAFSRHIERQAADTVDPAMVLAAIQDGRNLTASTLRRYESLARTAPLAAVLGRNVDASPASGVRGVALDADDRLCLEWTVVTLGPRTASALIARERTPTQHSSDDDRLFDFVLTFDRAIVAAVARLLLLRIGVSEP
ncbi:sensor domain-containing phosphodiesterase [Mycobacterium sp. C31M]